MRLSKLIKAPLVLIAIVLLFLVFMVMLNSERFHREKPTNRLASLVLPEEYDENGITLTRREVLNFPFHGYLVNAKGPFIDRVRTFNKALGQLRKQILSAQKATENATEVAIWTDDVLKTGKALETVWGADDNYLELLAIRHQHILTVALPWHHQDHVSSTKWNSLTDSSNVLVQRYYEWTADDKLCTLVETRGAIKMKYDAVFNRSCERNQSLSATRPKSISPLFFNTKPIWRNHYWPNDGDSLPASFYTETPPFVFHLHLHRNAVANEAGDVFSGSTALLIYLCRNPFGEKRSSLPSNVLTLPLHNEILTLSQLWGASVFHRMVEVIPRVVVYMEFLLENPNILIQVPGSQDDTLSQLLEILGLDKRRFVRGAVRANILYQPRPTGCGMANVQESQLASKLYRHHISRTFFPLGNRTRDRLIAIRRSGSRRFTEQKEIETQLKALAAEFGLTYELFADNPTPSLADTMKLFNSAVLIVGPHGAGLSNMIFSEPDTYVVEGVCNIPHVNLCFQRLAHVLGHRWHGVLSRGGCEGVIDAAASSIISAARTFLNAMKSVNATSI